MAIPNHTGMCACLVAVSTFGDTQMKHFKRGQKAAGGQAGKLKRQTVPLLMELMRTWYGEGKKKKRAPGDCENCETEVRYKRPGKAHWWLVVHFEFPEN